MSGGERPTARRQAASRAGRGGACLRVRHRRRQGQWGDFSHTVPCETTQEITFDQPTHPPKTLGQQRKEVHGWGGCDRPRYPPGRLMKAAYPRGRVRPPLERLDQLVNGRGAGRDGVPVT